MIDSLCREMDEASDALMVFDEGRLESVRQRLQGFKVHQLERSLAVDGASLDRLLRKHSMLGHLLQLTAANLRVMVSLQHGMTGEVLRLER